jgi:hypothetical protein
MSQARQVSSPSLAFALVLSVLSALVATGGVARAQDEEAPAKTTKVVVGIYANQVPLLVLKDNKFQVDFYIWFRWSGDDVKPQDTFELANGKIDSRLLIAKEVKAGENYAVLRCTATVVKFWDVKDFPFDDHVLELQIEDTNSEENLLTYVPDTENSTVSPDLRVPGWVVTPSKAAVVSTTYRTNYGDITLPKDSGSTYSRFVFSIPIIREGGAAYLKLFFAMYVAVLIALLSFFIMPNDAGPRLGFAIGAIFASVGASYVIGNAIPLTSTITVAERVNLLTVGAVFLALGASVFSVRRFKMTNKLEWSLKFDRITVAVLLVLYFVGNVLVTR